MRVVQRQAGVARTGVRVLVAAVALALTIAGVTAATQALRPDPARGTLPALTGPGPFAVGQPVRTRLGVVRVTGVETLGGLSAQDLASGNHGVSHLVPEGQTQVQVALRVTNDTAEPVRFTPELVKLHAGSAAAVTAMSATLPANRITAGVSLEGKLGFVASSDGSALRLELPGTDGPVVVDLGRTDHAAAGTGPHGPTHR